MNNYDLAILIPARNEMFLAKTVEDVLRNKRGKTEVIVGLDGKWADPRIIDHPDVTIFYSPESLGQRGMTNQLCRLTKAKYVMKLDAHCAVDEGFDVKMMEVMQDNYTLVPLMRNLHVFDWVCIGGFERSGKHYDDPIPEEKKKAGCGNRIYQGPTPDKCPQCGGKMDRELMWKAKESPKSTAFRFDKTLHFQYWNDFKKRPEGQGKLTKTLSIQGSCFMLTREKYWKLNICDEGHGSWGQQGVEVALKTWTNWEDNGEVYCNQETWYAHTFRTQGGDFGFPYPLSGSEIDKARKYSRKIWLEDHKEDFEKVLQMFYPVPDWHEENKVTLEEPSSVTHSKGIIFYTDNQLNTKVAHKVQNNLKKMNIPIVSASLKPMPHFGDNVYLPFDRGVITYFMQIITALKRSDAEIVYFSEHDVLYHSSHFDFIPDRKDRFYFNQNFWRVREDGFAVHWDANQVSGLVCYRELALQYYQEKLKEIEKKGFDRSYEPGRRDTSKYIAFKSEYPNIDIRYGNTLTKSKWSPNDFRDKSTCVNWQESRIEAISGWSLKITDIFPTKQ